tara:strand:- start:140 stop:241 length:102 start_codon:yes stop_codon:yes gene_type:complete
MLLIEVGFCNATPVVFTIRRTIKAVLTNVPTFN